MTLRTAQADRDRISLAHGRGARSRVPRRTPAWTLLGGLLASTVLFWMMVQLGQASDPKPVSVRAARIAPAPAPPVTGKDADDPDLDESSLLPPAPALQGPALETPREIIGMLDQRKRDLDRREQEVRKAEERLLILKADVEGWLAKNEALEKRLQQVRDKQDQGSTEARALQVKAQLDRERQLQAQKVEGQARLAKMYESMDPEEAAARLERMPDRKAVEILRLVKGKTAGTILAQVKADRAAKLTEALLAETRPE